MSNEPGGAIWFANRGQILQLIFSGVALVPAGIIAWPAVKNLELLTLAPLLFYIVFAAFALAIVVILRRSPRVSLPTTTLSAATSPSVAQGPVSKPPAGNDDESIPVNFSYKKFTLAAGRYYEIPRGISPIRIVLKDVTTFVSQAMWTGERTVEGAEIEVTLGGGLVSAGVSVKQLGVNKYICPVTRDVHQCEESSLFAFAFETSTSVSSACGSTTSTCTQRK